MSTQARKLPPARSRSRLLLTLEQVLALPAADRDAALDQASDLVRRAAGADSVAIYLHDAAAASLVAVAVRQSPAGKRQQEIVPGSRIPLAGGGPLVEVLRMGPRSAPTRVAQEGTLPPDPARKSILLPIQAGGVPRGVLQVTSIGESRFTDTDQQFLGAVASWMGLVVERAELAEQQARDASEHRRFIDAEAMVTVLAHDLGNYLTSLLARLDLLRLRSNREGRERDEHDVIGVIQVVRRLQRLIASLLDVTRLDQGVFSLSRRSFDLAALARACAEVLQTPTTEVVVQGPAELVTDGDPDRVQQAIENVIGNAIKHGAKGIPVAVTLEAAERDGRRAATIMVRDHGPGISPELLPRLFQRFSAGPGSSGLGLGLYLARGIAEAHGGTVTVESTPDQGTTVWISLPMP